MEEREQKKLTKMLTKWGVPQGEMDQFLKEYYASLKEDDPKEEPEAEASGQSDPNVGANTEKEEPKSDVSAEENGKTGEAEPPAKEEEAAKTPDGSEEQTAGQTNGGDEKKEEALAQDAGSKEDEYKKAIDGLNAKFDGLIDSLTKAGFLTQEKPQVGAESENLPANDTGGSTKSALDIINKGRRY